jgi:hypothetical protein
MKSKKKKFDWLNILKWINNTLSYTINEEVIRREIAYCEKIAKRFGCKYIYTIYYEEGFCSFIHFEDLLRVKEWHTLDVCSDEIDKGMTVLFTNYNNLVYDAYKFYSGNPDHIVATNITKDEVQECEVQECEE